MHFKARTREPETTPKRGKNKLDSWNAQSFQETIIRRQTSSALKCKRREGTHDHPLLAPSFLSSSLSSSPFFFSFGGCHFAPKGFEHVSPHSRSSTSLPLRTRQPTGLLGSSARALLVEDPLEASPLCGKVALADVVEDHLEASPLSSKIALGGAVERRSLNSARRCWRGIYSTDPLEASPLCSKVALARSVANSSLPVRFW